MSSTTSTNAIQRFTYDWLIRFCELHPINRDDFQLRAPFSNYPWHQHSRYYASRCSKYYRISTCFANLVEKYMPYVRVDFGNNYYNDVINGKPLPQTSRTVILIGFVLFYNFTADTITNFYNKKRVYFNWLSIQVENSILTPVEFKQLIRGARDVYFTKCSLTQPVLYSDIWPLLRRCTAIYFDVENLIYDDKMPETLAKTTWLEQRQQVILPNFELSEDKVLPIVEYFANVQVGEYFELVFKPGFLRSSLDNLLVTVEKKFKAAGFTVEENVITSNNDGAITFRKQSDTTILLGL